MGARFQELVEHAPDGVVILQAGRIVFINATAARLLGVEASAALGTPIARYLPPADAAAAGQRIGHMIATGEPMPPNEYGTLADPDRVVEIKSITWTWEGQPAVLAFARDVSERKAMQQRLVHADRLAAVGLLAAGVAHEINNPLQFMHLGVQMIASALRAHPEMSAAVAESLRDLDHGIERIATITRGLRAFTRPRAAVPAPVDAVAVVRDALKMIDNDLRHRARLVRELPDAMWVVANEAELGQVVLNLLLNATQALTGKPDDTIWVAVRPARAGEIAIEVRDSGHGMTPTVLGRVFDPFFTTKPVGSGMGLGLSVSKGIIDAFGGSLVLTSAPDQGTTATVTLRAHAAPTEPMSVPDGELPRARRRVLVLDDEVLVREMLAAQLRRSHDVVVVGDGELALAALREERFDAILCDVMMPGMSGADVYRRVATEHPGVERSIVFITGGAFVAEVGTFVASTGNQVLEKPFQVDAVLAAIDAVAD